MCQNDILLNGIRQMDLIATLIITDSIATLGLRIFMLGVEFLMLC